MRVPGSVLRGSQFRDAVTSSIHAASFLGLGSLEWSSREQYVLAIAPGETIISVVF